MNTTISVSELKANPSKVISMADDYPIAVKNRSKTTGYVVGKELFEKMILVVEDVMDREVIEKTDFSKGTNLENLIKELKL